MNRSRSPKAHRAAGSAMARRRQGSRRRTGGRVREGAQAAGFAKAHRRQGPRRRPGGRVREGANRVKAIPDISQGALGRAAPDWCVARRFTGWPHPTSVEDGRPGEGARLGHAAVRARIGVDSGSGHAKATVLADCAILPSPVRAIGGYLVDDIKSRGETNVHQRSNRRARSHSGRHDPTDSGGAEPPDGDHALSRRSRLACWSLQWRRRSPPPGVLNPLEQLRSRTSAGAGGGEQLSRDNGLIDHGNRC